MQRQTGVYVRISRDREGAGLGVERQEADCRELAEQLGWSVVDVYVDNDISAYSGKVRPAYRRMLSDLRSGRIDAVIAWHTDRLHRRVAELEEFVGVVQGTNAVVRTVRSGELDLASASGMLVARMLGAVAQHEIDHARERMRRAKSQAATTGKYRGGPRPYGFESDGVTVRPEEAVRVREAAELILAGRSLRAVVRHFNALGVRTSRDTEWHPNTLRAMLIRPRNAGLIGRTITSVVGPASWPAIVPEETWRAAGALLTDTKRNTNGLNPGRERIWLGSGIYRCGRCGETMRVARTTAGSTIYTCSASKHLTRDQARLDEFVRGILAERLRRPDLADLLALERNRGAARELSGEAQALRLRASQAEADYSEGLINGHQLQAATHRIEGRLAEVERQLAALEQSRGIGSVLASGDPASAFLASGVETQAAVLRALVDEVRVMPAPRGRPAGWTPGEPYFDPRFIDVTWRQS